MSQHGTRTRYIYGKCRCDDCRRANVEYHRTLKERLARRDPPQHGPSAYTNWGCRCAVCTDANKRKSAAWRERQAVT